MARRHRLNLHRKMHDALLPYELQAKIKARSIARRLLGAPFRVLLRHTELTQLFWPLSACAKQAFRIFLNVGAAKEWAFFN